MAQIDPNAYWALSVPAVRWGIDVLGAQRLHPTLAMYLYLRLKAKQGELAQASAASNELLSLISMAGNPDKPYYFPFIDRGRRDVGPLPTFWRAPNISGSWSAASIHRQEPGKWLADDNGNYVMPSDNADLALEHLMYGQKVSAYAMGAFFLRDDVVMESGHTPDLSDLEEALRLKFGFDGGDTDFTTLFHTEHPGSVTFQWFEPVSAEVLEAFGG